MKLMCWAVLASSWPALAACGSHGSYAPVVYGADQSRQARIYNSPNAQTYRRPTAQTAPRAMPASRTEVEEARLQPVSAVYLSEPGAVETLSKPAQRGGGVITVEPGDTVYAIGRRYQVSPQSIIAVNNLSTPYHLAVGQTLRLPNGAASAAGRADAVPARKVVARDTLYEVRPGDTLYSISRASGVQVKTIAQANALTPPYALRVGQQLLLPQAQVADDIYTAAAPKKPEPLTQQAARQPRDVAELAQTVSYTPPPKPEPDRLFDWPVKGAVVATYGAGDLGRRNDGVNIAAPAGTPVRAAADGEVVYRGSELDGFGNLLLVKHDDGFVTAYAHNDAMLVKKGQTVRKGQVIAKVGQTGAVTTPQLHFEIRQNLKSVDPVALLGPQ